jgi:hypothetical protein
MAASKTSPSNAVGDVTQSLQTFDLLDLQTYTREKTCARTASKDFHLFDVGRDDVHDILKYVLSRVSVSLYLNMFGFDDTELNDILMAKAMDPGIMMLITLDRSQAGSPHEKALLQAGFAKDPTAYSTYFVVGQSAARQISHSKGFVAVGGEGTFVITGKPGGPGYKAHNNTQSIFTDPDTISRFQADLIAEHLAAKSQQPAAITTAKAPARRSR